MTLPPLAMRGNAVRTMIVRRHVTPRPLTDVVKPWTTRFPALVQGFGGFAVGVARKPW